MNSLSLAAMLLVSLSSPLGGGGGGQAYEALDAGDVFVATITRVEDKDATNARPPRVWLEVHEVLRGEAKLARSPSLWSPSFHGIDWGGAEALEKRWNEMPLTGPKVGQKFILGGNVLKVAAKERDAPVYNLFGFVRIPYSDKARETSIAHLKLFDDYYRKYAEEQAAAAKERELRGQKRRAAIDDKVIDKRTQEADAVAIGQVTSGSGYEIETMLKGQPRISTGGKYYLSLPTEGYDKRIADLLYERPRCILFFSEQKLVASMGVIYAQLVDPYEGIMLADDAAIAAVKASLKKRPAPPPKPVLVISDLGRFDAAPLHLGPQLAQTARESFAVVQTHQFGGHGENTIVYARETIPHGAFLVMIERGPERRVRAVQITPKDALPVYDDIWREKDTAEQLKALVKKLVEKAR